MALCNGVFRSNYFLHRLIFGPFISKIMARNVHNSESQRTGIDVLDEFTTQLVQRKSDRWETIRIKKNLNANKLVCSVLNTINVKSTDSETGIDIRPYTLQELDKLINTLFEEHNYKVVMNIVKQCLEYKICPSIFVLQKILSLCAQIGDRDVILSLQKLFKREDPELLKQNAQFLHYLAEATWIRGNISESLKLFDEVYRNNAFLRRKLRLMIKYLIVNMISERSEAALVMIINFTENLVKEYDDYFPLACVWQACFLSEWYADQCRATELLDKHEGLCNSIVNRIPYVVNAALRSHQPEVVHRLLELLLKYDMKMQYIFVLQSLFSYRYWQNDLRSCAEIIQWSLNLAIPLSTAQHEQFVSLLLKNNPSEKPFEKLQTPPNFQLKF